jgi:hypothetical protein
MTQAFNLSQLANNLDSTGRVDATDGLVNSVPVANGGTGASTAAAARTNLGVAAAVYAVPAGGIIMWSGAQAAIPSGWLLCNGSSGTPDLRDRFVIGAGNSYAVGASGGSKDAIVVAHNHGASSDSQGNHNHTIRTGDNVNIRSYPESYNIITGQSNAETLAYVNQGSDQPFIGSAGIHSHGITVNSAGSSGTNANLPPYYALCFIMKS